MANGSPDFHGRTATHSKSVDQLGTKLSPTFGFEFPKVFAKHVVTGIRFHGDEFAEVVGFEDVLQSLRVHLLGS
jgi:hypothetical protein